MADTETFVDESGEQKQQQAVHSESVGTLEDAGKQLDDLWGTVGLRQLGCEAAMDIPSAEFASVGGEKAHCHLTVGTSGH